MTWPASSEENSMVYSPGSLLATQSASRSDTPSGPGSASSRATVSTLPFASSEIEVTVITAPRSRTILSAGWPLVTEAPERTAAIKTAAIVTSILREGPTLQQPPSTPQIHCSTDGHTAPRGLVPNPTTPAANQLEALVVDQLGGGEY